MQGSIVAREKLPALWMRRAVLFPATDRYPVCSGNGRRYFSHPSLMMITITTCSSKIVKSWDPMVSKEYSLESLTDPNGHLGARRMAA
jgi:hypothetical protein